MPNMPTLQLLISVFVNSRKDRKGGKLLFLLHFYCWKALFWHVAKVTEFGKLITVQENARWAQFMDEPG